MKKWPWHTALLALFPILSLFGANMEFVQSKDLWLPLIISLSGVAIVTLLFQLLFKDWVKSGLVASLIAVLFFNYGWYQDGMTGNSIPFYPKNIHLDHNFYKWFSLCLILLLSWRLFKRVKPLFKLNAILNLVAAVLVASALFEIGVFQLHRANAGDINMQDSDNEAHASLDPNRPTIYYLIMDAYTRQDILKDYFNYDNSDFTNFLKAEGFYVAEKSISNYGQTILSIPSSMNMTYMDSVITKVGEESPDRWPMSKVLNNSKVMQKMRKQKYRTVAYDAAMFDVVYLKSADDFHETPGTKLSLFHNALINATAIRSFNRRKSIKTLSSEDYHRKKITDAFDLMEKIPKEKEPHYVHGHILAPHQPFLFNADGSPRPMHEAYNIWSPLGKDSDNTWYKEGYVAQLQYINSRLKKLITKIIHHSKRPAIIILQGDHGTASELRNHEGFEGNDFKERFAIMNAYYFPDKDYSMLYPTISPVNSFKVVMNKFFKGKHKLEPDRAFYSDWDMPYDLYDVTDKVRR